MGDARPTPVKAHCPPAANASTVAVRPEPHISPGRPAAEQEATERATELDGHGVV